MSLQREILSPVTTAGMLLEDEQVSPLAKSRVTHPNCTDRHAQRVKHHTNCHCFRCHPEQKCKDPRKGILVVWSKSPEELEKINNKRKQSIKLLWKNDEYREKQMKTRQKTEQRNLHGKILSQWNKSHKKEFLKNSLKGTRNSRKYNTDIEIIMGNALKTFNLFQPQQRIKNICVADFIDWKHKIVVFCDGTYWHQNPKVHQRDIRINKKLRSLGFKVFRFTDEHIKHDLKRCLYEINLELGHHGVSTILPTVQSNG